MPLAKVPSSLGSYKIELECNFFGWRAELYINEIWWKNFYAFSDARANDKARQYLRKHYPDSEDPTF